MQNRQALWLKSIPPLGCPAPGSSSRLARERDVDRAGNRGRGGDKRRVAGCVTGPAGVPKGVTRKLPGDAVASETAAKYAAAGPGVAHSPCVVCDVSPRQDCLFSGTACSHIRNSGQRDCPRRTCHSRHSHAFHQVRFHHLAGFGGLRVQSTRGRSDHPPPSESLPPSSPRKLTVNTCSGAYSHVFAFCSALTWLPQLGLAHSLAPVSSQGTPYCQWHPPPRPPVQSCLPWTTSRKMQASQSLATPLTPVPDPAKTAS